MPAPEYLIGGRYHQAFGMGLNLADGLPEPHYSRRKLLRHCPSEALGPAGESLAGIVDEVAFESRQPIGSLEDRVARKVLRMGCDPQFLDEGLNTRLVGPEPGGPEVEAVLGAQSPSKPLASLEDNDRLACVREPLGCDKAGNSGAYNDDVEHAWTERT